MGRNDIAQRQEMQIQQQNAAMQQQAFADQQTALAEQRAAAAKQQEQAAAFQQDLMISRDAIENKTWTPEMANALKLKYAGNFDEQAAVVAEMQKPMQDEIRKYNVTVAIPLMSGDAETAIGFVEERIAAAKASGNAAEVQAQEAFLQAIKTNPHGAGLGLVLTSNASGLFSDDLTNNILEKTQTGQKPTDAIRTQDAQLRLAGIVPKNEGGDGRYELAMEKAGSGDKGPLVTIGAGETEFEKKSGAEAATQFSAVANQGTAAARSLFELDNLETLLSGVDTGGGATVKNYLGGFGIATEGLSEIQAINAAISRLVPAQRAPGSGTMTDADLLLFRNSLPSLINQPGGNKLIIDTLRAINEYDVAASIIAGQVLDGEITRKEARKALLELQNPLAGFKAPKAAPTPTTEPVVIDGVTIQRIE
jgi:flagellar protein FlgJ